MFNYIKTHQAHLIFIGKNLLLLSFATNITQYLLQFSNTHYNYFLVAFTIGSIASALYALFAGELVKKAYHRILKFIWLEYFLFLYLLHFLQFIDLQIAQQFGQDFAAALAFFSSWLLLALKPRFCWRWIFAMCFTYGIKTFASKLMYLIPADSLYSQIIKENPDLKIAWAGMITVIVCIIGLVIYNSLTKKINKN
jgi:hypothetical protein